MPVAKRGLALTADKRVVERGHPDARELLVGEGGLISDKLVQHYQVPVEHLEPEDSEEWQSLHRKIENGAASHPNNVIYNIRILPDAATRRAARTVEPGTHSGFQFGGDQGPQELAASETDALPEEPLTSESFAESEDGGEGTPPDEEVVEGSAANVLGGVPATLADGQEVSNLGEPINEENAETTFPSAEEEEAPTSSRRRR